MKFKVLLLVGLATLSSGFLTACTPDISAGSYSTGQIGQAANTGRGTIIAATPIKVSSRGVGSESALGVGSIAGGLAGAAGGSAIGGGTRMNVIGGVGGAVLGGLIGNYAEQKLTTQTGMQYTVKLRNGQVITVSQGLNPILGVGQRVFVIFSNPARVVADTAG
jgi:outer membrane lipoprotein SlyB